MRTILFFFLFVGLAYITVRSGLGSLFADGFGAAPEVNVAQEPAAETAAAATEWPEAAERKTPRPTADADRGEPELLGVESGSHESVPRRLELVRASVLMLDESIEPPADSGIPFPGKVVDLMISATMPPSSSPPELLNKDDLVELVHEHYPDGTRRAGRGGTVELTLLVDATGTVDDVIIEDRLSFNELNLAAVNVAKGMRFAPAVELGRNVESEVEFTLTFQP